jgi:hypothetical protein
MTARSPRIFAIHLNGAVFLLAFWVLGTESPVRGCVGVVQGRPVQLKTFVWRCDNLTLVILDPFGDISIYRVAPN